MKAPILAMLLAFAAAPAAAGTGGVAGYPHLYNGQKHLKLVLSGDPAEDIFNMLREGNQPSERAKQLVQQYCRKAGGAGRCEAGDFLMVGAFSCYYSLDTAAHVCETVVMPDGRMRQLKRNPDNFTLAEGLSAADERKGRTSVARSGEAMRTGDRTKWFVPVAIDGPVAEMIRGYLGGAPSKGVRCQGNRCEFKAQVQGISPPG